MRQTAIVSINTFFGLFYRHYPQRKQSLPINQCWRRTDITSRGVEQRRPGLFTHSFTINSSLMCAPKCLIIGFSKCDLCLLKNVGIVVVEIIVTLRRPRPFFPIIYLDTWNDKWLHYRLFKVARSFDGCCSAMKRNGSDIWKYPGWHMERSNRSAINCERTARAKKFLLPPIIYGKVSKWLFLWFTIRRGSRFDSDAMCLAHISITRCFNNTTLKTFLYSIFSWWNLNFEELIRLIQTGTRVHFGYCSHIKCIQTLFDSDKCQKQWFNFFFLRL